MRQAKPPWVAYMCILLSGIEFTVWLLGPGWTGDLVISIILLVVGAVLERWSR